ncbi:MAG: cation:proton antiporter, partial [Acidobacteriaceae bacterium]
MTLFVLLSVLVSLAAIFSLISSRVLRLPTTVGVMLLSLGSSIVIILAGRTVPGLQAMVAAAMSRIDFTQIVLHGMLAFLLFAGALHLDLDQLSREKLPVFVLSVLGTVLSTGIIAILLKLIFYAVGLSAPTITCLLFGALISPTDPIAVLEMLRRVGVPASLETQLAGESLFNDGVGAVLFLSLLEASQSGRLPSLGSFLSLLIVKAGGGVAVGLLLGYLVYRMLLLVDSYRVEVLLTIALAMGGYALADVLGFSAPLEAVAAGLIAGGRARTLAMSPLTRDNVDKFWELADDILNVILFLLMGLELLVLPWSRSYIYAGLLAIPAMLLARFVSVGASFGLLRIVRRPARGTLAILTWGGLRGGLAIALALAVPPGPQRNQLLAITYIVVVFSIMVQGLT